MLFSFSTPATSLGVAIYITFDKVLIMDSQFICYFLRLPAVSVLNLSVFMWSVFKDSLCFQIDRQNMHLLSS